MFNNITCPGVLKYAVFATILYFIVTKCDRVQKYRILWITALTTFVSIVLDNIVFFNPNVSNTTMQQSYLLPPNYPTRSEIPIVYNTPPPYTENDLDINLNTHPINAQSESTLDNYYQPPLVQ